MEMKFPVPRHPAISSINQQASWKKKGMILTTAKLPANRLVRNKINMNRKGIGFLWTSVYWDRDLTYFRQSCPLDSESELLPWPLFSHPTCPCRTG